MIARAFPDPVADDPAAMALAGEAELAASLAAALADGPAPEDDLWLFAYGSLMWRPEPEIADAERRLATVAGWHRRFCLWQWRHRGTRAAPGLMLALDRGGSCTGIVLRVAGPGRDAKMQAVWRREMTGNGYRARWVTARTPDGPVRALTFVINDRGERYAGRLDDETVARHIATACGHRGPAAEYLLETVAHCEELGIHDRHLWKIQALVAAQLA
jgi:cation transport protein ChaC